MTYGDYEVVYPDQRRHFPNEFAHLGSGALESKSVLASLMEIDDASVSGSVWRILFKTDFIKNNSLLFPEHICMSEDFYFIMKCLEKNQKYITLILLYIYIRKIILRQPISICLLWSVIWIMSTTKC